MSRLTAVLAAVVCLLGAVSLPAASTINIPDLRELQQANLELAGLIAEIEGQGGRRAERLEALARQIADEERSVTVDDVTPALLRDARLDLDTVRARLVVVDGRIEQRRLSLVRLEAMQERLEHDPEAATAGTTEQLRAEVARDLLDEQATLTVRVIDAYRRLSSAGRRHEALLEQRLRLLQSRVRLDALVDRALFDQDPRLPLLESVIADHLRRAVALGSRLSAFSGDDEAAQARRRILNVQLDDAVTRSFLRQNDLELIRAGRALDDLKALRNDDLMPLHVLAEAEGELAAVHDGLKKIATSLLAQRGVLEARRDSLRRHGGDDAPELSLIDDLEQLIDLQRIEIDALLARVDAEGERFQRVISDRYAVSLFEHRPLPAAADWRRVGGQALLLPSLLGAAVTDTWSKIDADLNRTSAATGALAAVAASALAVAMLWGRRRLLALAGARPADSLLALFERSLARTLPAAVPAAVWLLSGLIIGIGGATLWPLFLLLSLIPALGFMLVLARGVLYVDEPEDGVEDARDWFYAKLRLGLILATLIAVIYVVSRGLPVAPLLADLFDRLAMLGVLVLALPAFALRNLLLWLGQRGPARLRPRMTLLAWASRAVPVFLVASGGIGLAGYTDLAWTLVGYLAWAVMVGLLLFLVIGVLIDLRDRVGERISSADSELGDFWRTHFVEPGYRLCVLLSVLGAGWLLFHLWDWNAQTPIVRGFAAVIGTPLFKVGESAFAIADILLALVLVAAAFYIGGWSQQVSYNLTYRRVRDAGLRQALATFTHYVVIVAGVLLALRIIGFDLTTLTVFAASLGVGIGFGLQNIINNFVSGILLLAERPLKVGDFVGIGSNLGSVTRIGIRSLTVRTLDKQEVIIPNGSVISGEFTNWTRSDDVLRHVLYVGIRYGDDAELALELIRQVLTEHPHVLDDPEPGVFLWEYADSAVNIRLQYCFSMNDGPGGLVIRSEVLLAIGKRFKEHGIAIPFPQRDVTMHLGEDSRAALAGLGGARGSGPDTSEGGTPRVGQRPGPRLEPPADPAT